MTYPEVIRYLDSFVNYEKKSEYPYRESLKLERIRDFLKLIDNPQDSFKSIHVAGTKGKGSVCCFTANILKEAGFRTGLYTSPHLSDVRERIRILDPQAKAGILSSVDEFEGMISPDGLVALVENLKPGIDDYCKRSRYGPLSFFEVYTALAFAYFKKQKVDFAVLETGLGGRLDATNAVKAIVSVITSISYDHTNKLGNTLTEIAGEKAGIIKDKDSIVISASQQEEAAKVIRQRCEQKGAILFETARHIDFELVSSSLSHQVFNVSGSLGQYRDLRIRLPGIHQILNAVVATGIIGALNKYFKTAITQEMIRNGLYNTSWPARFEIVSDQPPIIIDGAHNQASAKALKEASALYFGGKKLILVLGVSADKDLDGICRELLPESSQVILTRADNPRALKPEEILDVALAYKSKDLISITHNVEESLSLAKMSADKNAVIIFAGSLFVAAEARELILSAKETVSRSPNGKIIKV